jgi:integrase
MPRLGRDVFAPAARSVGLVGLVPHGLPHTAASLAIAAGADVKARHQGLFHLRSQRDTLSIRTWSRFR